MAEVAAIHVPGGVVELGYGLGHGASHASTDDQGHEFDDREEDKNPEENVFNTAGDISQRGKQMGIENRWPGSHSHESASPAPFASRPIHYGQRSAEGDLAIHHVGRRRERSHGERRMENLFIPARTEAGFSIANIASRLPL